MKNQYKEFYRKSNELAQERMELAAERIGAIAKKAEEVPAVYQDYFQKTGAFLLKLAEICGQAENGVLETLPLAAAEKLNQELYAEIFPGQYGESYANPTYAVKVLGTEFGRAFSLLTAHFRSQIAAAYQGKKMRVTIAMELFVEVYNTMEQLLDSAENRVSGETAAHEVQQAVYWYFHDYSEIFIEERMRSMFDAAEDFALGIVMDSDLGDLSYLYRYGLPIGENERKTAEFLNTLSEQEIQKIADTYTEGFRLGFVAAQKDITKKNVVYIYNPVGFERVIRAAVKNFEKMGLAVTMRSESTSPNKQYAYDHEEDRAYYLDKALVERELEVRRAYMEEHKELAAGYAGPAVMEVFGETPFSPKPKDERFMYDEKQEQLCVYEMSEHGRISNHYIPGDEYSFTIIAFPIPEIGEKFREIFAETVKVNTLDYKLYQGIQQKLIDALDEADRVHITGKGANKTDLYVNIWKLENPKKETAFENCVADVNIPVGEVFTSPVLQKTEGTLFVSQVYLKGRNYENLEVKFTDGMVSDYSCTNFADEKQGKKYIRDNVLMRHDTLPMGEFAIGTNTTAYRMARTYQIADKLPILIAEKTGPHFAVGDTCYSHEEDRMTYNPDGKAIVARENSVSALRKVPEEEGGGEAKAYLNCHTDITIPYDELDKITVIRKDGSETDIIAGGRFVLPGTEELNIPLD